MKSKCEHKKLAQAMVLYLYDELPEVEKRQLEEHLRECRSCMEEFNKLKGDFAKMNGALAGISVPGFDWRKSWWIIRRSLKEKSAGKTSLFSFSGWVLKFAAAAVIFVIGMFAGKIIFFSPQVQQKTIESRSTDTPSHLTAVYREHFEDVKTTIMEYANYREGDDASRFLLFEKGRVKGLLSRNRLLKNYVSGEEFLVLKQLLDELEMILIEISNLTAHNPDYLRFIKDQLKEKEIIFKMNYFKLEKLKSSNI